MPAAPIKKTPAYDSLLEAGYALLLEHDGDMGGVKMQEVTKRAGLTSGAFYNVWPNGLPAFQQSLLEFALKAEHISYLGEILGSLESVGPEVTPLSEVARQFGAADAEHLRRDAGFRVQVALWARHGSDAAVAAALGASYREMTVRYVEVYESVLHAYGRTWREPFDAPTFATLLTALAEGLAMRSAVDPESTPADLSPDATSTASSWELFGLSIAVLLASVTRPVTEAGGSVWEVLRRLDSAAGSSIGIPGSPESA